MLTFEFNEINKIAKCLKENKMVAFPTETVFGLGINVNSKDNFDRLVKVKNRKPNKPFTLMFSKFNQIKNYVAEPKVVKKIVKKLMPGEITIIVKSKENVPEYFDLKSGFIGLRMPNSKNLLKVISRAGSALFVPSCNKADEIPCKDDNEVIKIFSKEIDAVVKGKCENGVPSTVVKIDGDKIELLREGNLSLEKIKEALK